MTHHVTSMKMIDHTIGRQHNLYGVFGSFGWGLEEAGVSRPPPTPLWGWWGVVAKRNLGFHAAKRHFFGRTNAIFGPFAIEQTHFPVHLPSNKRTFWSIFLRGKRLAGS
jgi:hypothetical protein